jgi:hypothetical protein
MAYTPGLSPSRREIDLLLAIGHTWISLQTWSRLRVHNSTPQASAVPTLHDEQPFSRAFRLLRLLTRLELACSLLLFARAAWRMSSS